MVEENKEKKENPFWRFADKAGDLVKDFGDKTSKMARGEPECKAWIYGTKECKCKRCIEYESRKKEVN